MKSIPGQRISRSSPTRSFLHWSSHFFFIVAILTLGYVTFTLLDAKLYQAREAHRFEQAQQAQKMAMSGGSESPVALPLPEELDQPDGAASKVREDARARPVLGRIEIVSIGLSSMVLEGIDRQALQRGVGHVPGTALPGQPGNVALAGHRDTFFRALRNIRKDDEITLETLNGSYRYRVDLTQVVAPEDTDALKGSDDAILTLVTCYPFSFVGPAPQRFIVRAHRVSE